MKNIIICDIDGTLADCSHRRHFVEPPLVDANSLTVMRRPVCPHCEKPLKTPHAKNCIETVKSGWKPDWKSFYDEFFVMQDELIAPVWHAVEGLLGGYGGLLSLKLCTGRMEKHRKITKRWLKDNDILGSLEASKDSLMMRADDDHRDDFIVKEEMLMKIGVENVYCVFDDRKSVCEMWRKHGLTVFQVAEGDF